MTDPISSFLNVRRKGVQVLIQFFLFFLAGMLGGLISFTIQKYNFEVFTRVIILLSLCFVAFGLILYWNNYEYDREKREVERKSRNGRKLEHVLQLTKKIAEDKNINTDYKDPRYSK